MRNFSFRIASVCFNLCTIIIQRTNKLVLIPFINPFTLLWELFSYWVYKLVWKSLDWRQNSGIHHLHNIKEKSEYDTLVANRCEDETNIVLSNELDMMAAHKWRAQNSLSLTVHVILCIDMKYLDPIL